MSIVLQILLSEKSTSYEIGFYIGAFLAKYGLIVLVVLIGLFTFVLVKRSVKKRP